MSLMMMMMMLLAEGEFAPGDYSRWRTFPACCWRAQVGQANLLR